MMFAMQDDFADVAPLDADYAEQRQKWERLYKATQVKGDGEAHPLLSPDEFADFETWDYGDLDATQAKTHDMLPGGYARTGLQRGLMLQDKLGVNPFKFGMVGAGDNHVSMSSPDNDDFFGRYATYEPSPHRVFSEDGTRHVALENKELGLELDSFEYITSGVTAVRATENTRGAIFDAMERREVYPTTGPRIRVRLFGGWDFQAEDARRHRISKEYSMSALRRSALFLLILVIVACGGADEPSSIEGRWDGGSDWGEVNIVGLDGTYSSTFGSDLGEITLTQVSDSEFTGTWGEGTLRFGTLDLSLDSNTRVTGNWTADPDSEVAGSSGGLLIWER